MGVNAAGVLMPKTASDFHYLPQAWKNQIWLSWQSGPMEAEAVAHGMCQAAYGYFRDRVFTSDSAHVFTAPVFGERIYHVKV